MSKRTRAVARCGHRGADAAPGRPSESGEATPFLSVVIPVRDEQDGILGTLQALRDWKDCETVVAVDPVCRDASAELAASVAGVRIVTSAVAGRGAALVAGAGAARGRFLLFLHADCRIEEDAVRAAMAQLDGSAVRTAMARHHGNTVAAAFRVRLDSGRRVFRLLEAGINLRSRLFGLPYGDQGLLISRTELEQAGGFRPLPRCEDLDLVLRLRRRGKIVIAPGPCSTSTRRWDREGIVAVTVKNLMTLTRFYTAGGIPEGDGSDELELAAMGGDGRREPAPVDRRALRG